MSIFRRIIDITKANINHHLGDVPKTSQQKKQQHQTQADTHSARADRSQQHDEPPPPPPQSEPSKLEKAYAALEIPVGSDLKTAKRAWREQLRKYHPDLHSGSDEQQKIAHEVSQQLNEAYHTIRDHLT